MPTSVTEVAIYSQTSEFSNTFRSKVVDDLRYKSLSGEPLGDSPPRLSRAQARNATLSAGARADKPVKTDCAISPIVLWFALSRTLPRLSDGFYGGIELCFGRAAVERYGQSLNNFSRIGPDHVAAKHSVTGAVDY